VGYVFLAHFRSLRANWALLNSMACIVSDHVHLFMATMYPSSDGNFQQDNATCHKAQIVSNWFIEHDNEFTVLKWPPQSPDLSPIEHLWDVVEREVCALDVHHTNFHQLHQLSYQYGPTFLKHALSTLLNQCQN